MIGYVGLGSNLGDRFARIEDGVAALASAGIEVLAASSAWETEPVDAPGPQWFLNAVVRIATALSPEAALESLLDIERRFGRVRTSRNAPRALDLDLLTLGGLRRDATGLALPHPRIASRRFVLAPLAELAPDLVVPGASRTVAEALAALPPEPRARKVGLLALPGALPVYSASL